MANFTSRIRTTIDFDNPIHTQPDSANLIVSIDASRGVKTTLADGTGELEANDLKFVSAQNYGSAGTLLQNEADFGSEEIGFSLNHFGPGEDAIRFFTEGESGVPFNRIAQFEAPEFEFPRTFGGCCIVVIDIAEERLESLSGLFMLNNGEIAPYFQLFSAGATNIKTVRHARASFNYDAPISLTAGRNLLAWNWSDGGSCDVWVNGARIVEGAPVWGTTQGFFANAGDTIFIQAVPGHLGNLKFFGDRLSDNVLIPTLRHLAERYETQIFSHPSVEGIADFAQSSLEPWADPPNQAGTLPSRLNTLDIPHKFVRATPGKIQIVATVNGIEGASDADNGGTVFTAYAAEAASPVAPTSEPGFSSIQTFDLQTVGHYTLVMVRPDGGSEIHHIEVIS